MGPCEVADSFSAWLVPPPETLGARERGSLVPALAAVLGSSLGPWVPAEPDLFGS
jgi:hypothetical protein